MLVVLFKVRDFQIELKYAGRKSLHMGSATVTVLTLIGLVMATSNQALPPNPDRPNESKTCAEALDRLNAAIAGNPLVSAEENNAHINAARRVAELLCSDTPENRCKLEIILNNKTKRLSPVSPK